MSMMGSTTGEQISRRRFLLTGVGLVALSACSRSESAKPDVVLTQDPEGLDVLVASGQVLAGVDQRVALGVLRNGAPLAPDDDVTVAFGPDGGPLGAPLPVQRHAEGVEERPYYLVEHRFPQPGVYRVEVAVGGKTTNAPLQAVDPAGSKVPVPGRTMIRVATPTTTDARGVNPICTRTPTCPLHDVSLEAALDERRPLAVLFSTPALCQSAVCGPVLNLLLDEAPRRSDQVRLLHVEIYTDERGQTLAPAVQAYGLEFEPILFLAGADGVVRERLDAVFDRSELRAALDRLTAA